MRQDVTHFQLSALSNEDHVAKQLSVSFHDNLLGFSFDWFTLHCNEGLQFIFLMGSWEQSPFCISLLFEFVERMFSFLTRCQQVSTSGDATVPVEMLTRSEGSFPKGFLQLFSKRSTIEATSDSFLFMRVFSRSVCFVVTLP